MEKLVIVRFDKHYICEYKNWQSLFDICKDKSGWQYYFESNASDLDKESFILDIAKRYDYKVMPKSDWIKLRNKNHLKTHNLKVEAFDFFLDCHDSKEIDYQANEYKDEKKEGLLRATRYNFQQWLINKYLEIIYDPC